MKRNLRATDTLLFLPILLIGGVGYWQQQRAQKMRTPTHIEVRSLEILPPTPRDVARGFDTRVRLSVGYRGGPPRGWGVTKVFGSKESLYGLTGLAQVVARQPGAKSSDKPSRKFAVTDSIETGFDADNDMYRGLYRLKLHGVPASAPVVLKGWMQSETLQVVPGQITNHDSAIVDSMSWSAVVRQQGIETPAPPKVSRYSGVKVTKMERRDVTNGTRFFDVQVTCAFAPSIASEKPGTVAFTPQIEDIYLVDKKGFRYRCMGYGPISDPNRPDNGSGPTPTFIFNSWETLPADVSGLRFHALLSVNDYWPLEIDLFHKSNSDCPEV